MNELIRKCIHLLVSNRPITSILTILLDYVIQQTGNKYGFIGERKVGKDNAVFYRYHAITENFPGCLLNTYMSTYKSQGYFDLDEEHSMQSYISTGEIYINNSPKITKVGHPPVEKILFLPLHDANNTVIGILGLAGSFDFTIEIADSYAEYTDMCGYILQLAIDRNNMNYHKNRFLTNVGNALRDPINGMLNVRKIVNSAQMTPVQKQYIDVVTFYSMKLLDMVNDIQDYTRMVSGNLILVNKSMDIHKCLDAVQLITQQKTSANVTLTFNRNGNLPSMIVADEVRITQILVNLLDNACKFTTKGSITLDISASPSVNNTHEIMCTISDTGIGMTQEQVYNIFGGTYIATHDSHTGVGLGLLIVKYLIEMFGGHISMESSPSSGTTVRFNLFVGHKHNLSIDQIKSHFRGTYALLHGTAFSHDIIDNLAIYGIKCIQSSNITEALRLLHHKSFKEKFKFKMVCFWHTNDIDKDTIKQACNSSVAMVTLSDSVAVPDDDSNFILNIPLSTRSIEDLLTSIIVDSKPIIKPNHSIVAKTRILIAEDNPESLQILTELLKRQGYTDIDTVTDGLELYIKLTTQTSGTTYQIVFVNIHIEVLDGITAIKRYKQIPSSPTSSQTNSQIIVGMSHCSTFKDQCYEAGMNAFILKPVTVSDISDLHTRSIFSS